MGTTSIVHFDSKTVLHLILLQTCVQVPDQHPIPHTIGVGALYSHLRLVDFTMNRGPDCVKMMCQGNIFYIYTSTNRAPVTIFYVPNTPDNLGSFYWCRVGELVRHEQCKFPLSILTDVMIGKQTASFQRPHAANTRSEQCMSLVSTLLTLDIEAVSDQVITDWVDGLTYILSVEGSKDLVDENPGAHTPTTTPAQSPKPTPPQTPQQRSGPPPPPGSAQNKRRFTVHSQGQDNSDAQLAAQAVASASAAAQYSNPAQDDQDDGETITGGNNLTDVVSQDDPALATAKQQARLLQSDDGLTALQRGGIVVHYRSNKPPQLLYLCHHTRPTEQLLGSLCTVPLVPLNNSTNNPTLTFSGADARTLSTYLNADALHLLRSIATGDVVRSKGVYDEIQRLTNNMLTIINNVTPAAPSTPGQSPGGQSFTSNSFGSGSSNSINNTATTTSISLDTMSDLFLGSTHQDFLQAKHCDPSATTTIITDLGPFSFETTDKYVLNIWINELQNLLNASGTDVIAADDDFQQYEQSQQVALEKEDTIQARPQSNAPPGPGNNRQRRFTVTRSEMPTTAGMPQFGGQFGQQPPKPPGNQKEGEVDPLDTAFRVIGLEFVQFPGAIPCMLTWTGPNSSSQQLIITDKFKKTLIDSAAISDLTQVVQGTAHTSVLATCGNPSLALSLTFKSPVTGGNNTWNLSAANVETFNAFTCGLNQFLFSLNRSLLCTQHAPSRTFVTQNHLLPHQLEWKKSKTSALMMAMSMHDSNPDEFQFQADLPSLIAMLTQGRIFTGFAERDQDVVMNKLTLFFMSPQELLSIAQMDPKKAQDPTRAAKLKTNVGAINPNTKGRLCWCAAGRRVPMSDSYLEIDEITDIFVGKQTKVLADHAEMFTHDRCFTIMASRDQLDLVADNSLQLLSWMRALHSLCGMTTTNNGEGKQGLQEVAIDNSDERLAQGTRGKRFSVSGASGPQAGTQGGAPSNFGPDGKPKKRLSLLVTDQSAGLNGAQKAASQTNAPDPRLVLGRGCRFLRYFTSHGQPQTQQVWVYHTSSNDNADRSKRAGSLRWIPIQVLAQTLGMSPTDPNPHIEKIGPTQWLSQIDRMMQTMSLVQLEETIKIVHTHSKDVFGAWGVLRLAHITDVYVGRTTSSLKTLVPPDRHLECFSIVSKDANKQQSVLSLRADSEQTITTWLHSIQHLILTGGKKLIPDEKESTSAAAAPTVSNTAGGPPPKPSAGRRFTVSSSDPQEAAAAAAAAAAGGTAEPDDQQNDPQQPITPQPTKQRRLTVKSNQAPPPIAPTILQPEVSPDTNKPKGGGRRFTVTKTQADLAASAANGDFATQPQSSPPPLPTTLTGPPPIPPTTKLPPPLDVSAKSASPKIQPQPTPNPQPKSLMPTVAPEIWSKLLTNEGVQALISGIEVTVYSQPQDEQLCQYTSVLQQSTTIKDIGVIINGSQRVHAKRCMLYYSPNGGKSGSVFLHTLNTDSSVPAPEYQQSISVYEYNKFSNEMCLECLPVHTLTDITIGKSDPLWKLVTGPDSKPIDPVNPSNVLTSSSSCLSLTSKFKPTVVAEGDKNTKVKKQLHLSAKHKSVVHSIVQALQYIIAQTGKKVLYDQNNKEPPTPTNTTTNAAVFAPPQPPAPPVPTATAVPPPVPTAIAAAAATSPVTHNFHEIANLLQGYKFTQHVRAGVSVKKFDIIISLHKSTQVMFSTLSTNQDPNKSNLARTHELAPTIRSFDLHSPSTNGAGPAMPNVTPVTAQDIAWRGLVESSGLGFFCIKDVSKDSKVWLPLGALTDVYLGQSANVPTNARTPQSMYTLSFSLTGGSSYHLILSAENEEEGKEWLLKQINGGDSGTDKPSTPPQGAGTDSTPQDVDAPAQASTGDPQMDEIIAYMSKRHLMFVYALVQGRLCRLRSYVWYDSALHAILWCTTDMNVRGPMFACPIASHNDTPTTSPLPPPRSNTTTCTCTAKCKRPPFNVLHLSAVNEVFVGRVESLLRQSTSDQVLSQLKIDEDSCATISADRLDVQGQPLPNTPDYQGYNIPVFFNLEASSANSLEEWLNGLQHLLTLRGANVIYS